MTLELGPGQTGDRWSALPEQARAQVLALLARLIARGVLINGEAGSSAATEAENGF
jgi:hypothetical protein